MSPILSHSTAKCSGSGATATYAWYIGVSNINGAAAALICSMAATMSGYQPARLWGVETTTSFRTTSGCWIAVRRATAPPIE